jgi:hypothetical protein
MVTTVPASHAAAPPMAAGAALRRRDHLFYSGMAITIAVVVFAGFAPTYFMRSYFRGPELTPLRLVHGGVFTAWIGLFVVQNLLVMRGRTRIHRRLGVAGAVLAAAMVVVGSVLAIQVAAAGRVPPGNPMSPRAFLVIPLFDLATFAPLIALAIYLRGRPEAHKRLMLLATISILGAAFGRLPPAQTYGPLFFLGMVDVLVLAGVAYDLATRRKVHPAYAWGGAFIFLMQPLRMMIAGTAAWLAVADFLVGR